MLTQHLFFLKNIKKGEGNMLEALVFVGVTTVFTIGAGLISIAVAERIIEEVDKMEEEKDYVYMKDGTPVEYNEDDQE